MTEHISDVAQEAWQAGKDRADQAYMQRRRILIDPITRLEGHGKIDIFLDEAGEVERAYFQVPELRGFEAFARGRPAEDMPQITSRICGVCPLAHHMASVKTLDDLYRVDPPSAAKKVRELDYSLFMVEDHALNFYFLGGPDFVVGPTAPKEQRNVLGVLATVGLEVGKRVIQMRRELRDLETYLGGKTIHPVLGLPGGVAKGIAPDDLPRFQDVAARAVDFAKFTLDVFHCDTTKKRPKSTQGHFDAGNFAWAVVHGLRLVRALARTEPDVVLIPIAGTWSGFLRDAALGWIARRTRARVIGHQHAGDIPRVLERRGPAGRVVRGGFAQFHRLLVLGERWRTLFRDYGLTMPIELCPSTFRREVFERGARAGARPGHAGPVRLLFVGQVGRRKGVLDLLAALRRLRDQGHDVTLTVVGPDQLPGELDAARARAAELTLGEAATFAGPLHGEALYAQFEAHDVFVLPSYNEGIPAVLYEAGTFELPVVTTPVGAIGDLVRDGENGLLIEPGDVDALTAALAQLAGDVALRARLGARLRDDVRAFHPDRAAERIVAAVRAELAAR